MNTKRDHLLGQLREANEKLVMAIVETQQLADDAHAARVAADHNEERFRSLIDASSAIVWQATADGQVQVDRDAWRRLTGVDPGQEQGGWLEAVHPDDRDHVRESWTEAVIAAKPYTCQHRIQSRDGGYAWVVARAVPVPKTGPVREWIGMMTDISDRVRVEEAREQFIGILGHDLRNPLASILMGVGARQSPGAILDRRCAGRQERASDRSDDPRSAGFRARPTRGRDSRCTTAV